MPFRPPWLSLLLMAVAVAVTGCNEQRDYQILSFFFDGVPDPNAPPTEAGSAVATVDAQGRPIAAGQLMQVYHQPYATRQCSGCHDVRTGYQAVTMDGSRCQSCHASHVQPIEHDWVHGAVVFGDCGRCHEPHRADHPGLLKAAQPQICFDCHNADYFKQDAFHSRLEDLTCSKCHDPHSAGNRLLLADSRTYVRKTQRIAVSEHGWTRDDCSLCHNLEQGNIVREGIDAVCQTCHSNVMTLPGAEAGTGGKLHQAVTDGKCTTCHTPHESTRPALIKPTAERVCSGCHDPAELPFRGRRQHPVIVRGDCLLCHQGHRSDEPMLLRPGVTARTPLPATLRPDAPRPAPPEAPGAGEGGEQ